MDGDSRVYVGRNRELGRKSKIEREAKGDTRINIAENTSLFSHNRYLYILLMMMSAPS